MKMLWKLSLEAIRYRGLYIIAILATLFLTMVNLAAPRVLSSMTGIVEAGVDEAGLLKIRNLTIILIFLYLGRIAFRFMSNYMAHKAAWYLEGRVVEQGTHEELLKMKGHYAHMNEIQK